MQNEMIRKYNSYSFLDHIKYMGYGLVRESTNETGLQQMLFQKGELLTLVIQHVEGTPNAFIKLRGKSHREHVETELFHLCFWPESYLLVTELFMNSERIFLNDYIEEAKKHV